MRLSGGNLEWGQVLLGFDTLFMCYIVSSNFAQKGIKRFKDLLTESSTKLDLLIVRNILRLCY